MKWITTIVLVTGLAMLLILAGCAPPNGNFDNRLGEILKPYYFSIAGWQVSAIPAQIKQLFNRPDRSEDNVKAVLEYFSRVDHVKALTSKLRAAQDDKQGGNSTLDADLKQLGEQNRLSQGNVGRIIAGQIKEVLSGFGIFNPVDEIGLRFTFPPVNFRLDSPPHVLVVSPRDKIDRLRETTLNQDINVDQIESIESRVDALGVSSLVVDLGGFAGTYPTFVVNNADLRFTIDSAIEEWLHQFLAFKPLGFRYLLHELGITKNYEIVTINETIAGLVSREIGAEVYRKYYPSQIKSGEAQQGEKFDFNGEMREIRKTVDKLLADGQIEQAERFMEQKRQSLETNGYYIRKLNQAYFAFHGAYADSPTSISPIGADVRKLRSQSVTLKEFINTVSGITSYKDLKERLK